MKNVSSLITILVLAISTNLFAQTKPKFKKDITPLEVREEVYKWGKGELEDKSFSGRMAAAADRWLNRYLEPIDGFVILKMGDKINGKMVIHNRYNDATSHLAIGSTQGTVIKSISIDNDKYAYQEIAVYGAQFKVSDWTPAKKSKIPADQYHPGYVQLEDGTIREGMVALTTSKMEYAGFRYYNKIYFAADQTADVEVFYCPEVDGTGIPKITEAGQTVAGKPIRYTLLRGSLIDQDSWITKITGNAKKMWVEELASGELEFQNGVKLNGKFAIHSAKKKTFVYLVDDDNDLYYLSAKNKGIKVLTINQAGGQSHYVMLDDNFVNNHEVKAKFEKNKSIHSGLIQLSNGGLKEGKISLKRAVNVVKSYRIPIGVYFIPSGTNSLVELFYPEDIDYLQEVVDGNSTKYVPLEERFVKYEEYLSSLEEKKSNEPTKNLHNGYIVFDDGRKIEGRIAQTNKSIVVVSKESSFEKYNAYTPGLSFFIQTIDASDRKFIPMDHGIRAFSGAGKEFVEVLHPDGAFSYYRNSNPTHLKKFATKLAKGAINTVTDVGRGALATAAAKQQIKSNLDNSDKSFGDVMDATAQGAATQAQVLQKTEGMVEVGDEGGIYHKEWIIVNNNTQEKIIVYEKNADELIGGLLEGCNQFGSLEKSEIRKLKNINNLDQTIQFLNNCN